MLRFYVYPRQKVEGERFCLGFKIGKIDNLFRISLREPLVPSYARCCFILFVLLPLAPLFCTSTVSTVRVHRSYLCRCCACPPQLPLSLLCASTTVVVIADVCVHLVIVHVQRNCRLLCASIVVVVRVHRRCCAHLSQLSLKLLCASTSLLCGSTATTAITDVRVHHRCSSHLHYYSYC